MKVHISKKTENVDMEDVSSKNVGNIRVRNNKRKILAMASVAVVLVVVIVVAVVVTQKKSYAIHTKKKSEQKSDEDNGIYKNGAVATDAKECSEIGRDILKKGGHAVDAAIAAMFCTGVVNFHSTGIGGGGFMNVYNQTAKNATIFDYRETSPAALRNDSFDSKNVSRVKGLKKKGHEVKKTWKSAIVNAIYVDKEGKIHAKSDSRKEGVAAGY